MNTLRLRPSLLIACLGLAAACGGGGGGSAGVGTTATLSGAVRVPDVAPAMLASDPSLKPMVPGEVVVWLEPGTDASELLGTGYDLVRSGGPIAVYRAHAAAGKSSLHDGAAVADCVEKATVDASADMGTKVGVRCASPNYILRARTIPNDALFPLQWHATQINLPQAWSITQGSSEVTVAVLDTGIVSAHPDFDPARFVDGFDMIADPQSAGDGDGRDNNPEDPGDLQSPQGSSFHGTHVAGTIGARTDNNFGIAGVDWNCKLMIVRVLGRSGGSLDDVANGILYAARLPNASGQLPTRRADVINMSLGASGLIPVLEAACDQAAGAGSLLVAAAGNDNSAEPESPAAFASVLSVGATDLVGARAPYSNFSTTVDVWAPGGDLSVDRNGDNRPDGVLSCMADDQGQTFFQFENGTSMASPHVAGIAALVKAANPALGAAQIRALLIGAATTQAGVDLPNGGRLVDALRAVQAAGGSAAAPLLVATPGVVDFGSAATTATVAIENRGTGNLGFSSFAVAPAAPWLSGSLTDSTPANGLDGDRLELTIDRTGLPNGVLQTVVTLTYLDGQTPVRLDLTVRVQVGASTPSSDTVFVLLCDPDTLEVRAQATTTVASNFAFQLPGIAAGDYLMFAGTDRDQDGFLGDEGELFGAFPDLDDPRPLTVVAGRNRSGISFGMSELVNVQSLDPAGGRRIRLLP